MLSNVFLRVWSIYTVSSGQNSGGSHYHCTAEVTSKRLKRDHEWPICDLSIFTSDHIPCPERGRGNWKTNIFVRWNLLPVLSRKSYEQCLYNLHENDMFQTCMKEVIHIISFEPISERLASKSFQEPSRKSVSVDMIGTFWRATTRELYCITWIERFIDHKLSELNKVICN